MSRGRDAPPERGPSTLYEMSPHAGGRWPLAALVNCSIAWLVCLLPCTAVCLGKLLEPICCIAADIWIAGK